MNLVIYVLDTDTVSLLREGHFAVCQRANQCLAQNLATTIITFEEQLTGWYTMLRRSKNDQTLVRAYERLNRALIFFSTMQVIPFDVGAAARASALKAQRIRIGTNDLRIACTCLEYGAVLVTRNRSDFEKIPNLQLEDWSIS